MSSKIMKTNHLMDLFNEGHREILEKSEALGNALTNLHYEGKASFGRNFKHLESILSFFNGPFKRHMEVEEEIVYPFFEKHVPRFEHVVALLQSEHFEIRQKLVELNRLVDAVGKRREHSLEIVESAGTYFIYLLRSHVKVESENIFRKILDHLSQTEIETLSRKVKNYMGRCSNGKRANRRSHRKAS